VSRIHVDDLAALAEAGLFSDLSGAWPVADELPCATAEIAYWTARLTGLPEIPTKAKEFVAAGRKVDGSAIRLLLGVPLAYPTWHSGVLASLAVEKCMG